MNSHLYFICPTDNLELEINKTFRYQNLFYTSLGNSVVFDKDIINEIEQLILKHAVQEISFVLSMTNLIISDALKNQDFAASCGLNGFYRQVLRQEGYSEVLGTKNNRRFTVLSYHLNNKIRELRQQLNEAKIGHLNIGGKIYNARENVFLAIYSHLICTEYISIN